MKQAPYLCPIEATLDLIGGKYKVVILYHLTKKTLRFSELTRLIPHATPKMLTQQLRDLESGDLIVRIVYPVVPPKVEYSLSELGKTLIPILRNMCDWGESYLEARENQVITPARTSKDKNFDNAGEGGSQPPPSARMPYGISPGGTSGEH